MEGRKFTLGAAILFEEITGKTVTSMEATGIKDLVAMTYAQNYWDKDDRPSLEDYTKSIAHKSLTELSEVLNGPFSQPAAQ